jgi:hypothetical protein
MNTKWVNYKELELIPDSFEEQVSKQSRSTSWATKAWKAITAFMTQGHDPKICQITDRDGQTWWNIYDPVTGQFTCLDSEEAVRVWIEQRYYRQRFKYNASYRDQHCYGYYRYR